jgi:regulator of extracellular matrix RemA (YlzA/DUF370 family)
MTEWTANIFTQCIELLERPISNGNRLLEIVEKEASALKRNNQAIETKLQAINEHYNRFSVFLDVSWLHDDIKKIVQANVKHDFIEDARNVLSCDLKRLESQCKQRAKSENLTFKDFKESMQ